MFVYLRWHGLAERRQGVRIDGNIPHQRQQRSTTAKDSTFTLQENQTTNHEPVQRSVTNAKQLETRLSHAFSTIATGVPRVIGT